LEYADFLVKSYFYDSITTANVNKNNDTTYLFQHFQNYYAYDDGSAESAYALTGNTNVSLAYRFNVKMQDTLRGVQIYFNPTGENVTNRLFQLTVWTDVSTVTQQSVEMYRMINQKPDSFEGINGFKTYLFDTLLVVHPGNIWVGFIQNDASVLYGVGFDKNTDARNNTFYYVDGIWSQSGISGSCMIRPLFGKRVSLVGIEEHERNVSQFSIWPNPVHGSFHLQYEDLNGKKYRYQVYDCLGKLIKEDNVPETRTIDVSDVSSGIYFVRLHSKDDTFDSVQKLVIE
jgi:hypothetical protein